MAEDFKFERILKIADELITGYLLRFFDCLMHYKQWLNDGLTAIFVYNTWKLWKCSANLKQTASKSVDMLDNLLSQAGIHAISADWTASLPEPLAPNKA